MDDYELIAEKVSLLSGQVSGLENRLSDVLTRMADVEKVNHRLEEAALTGPPVFGGHVDVRQLLLFLQ